MNTYDELPAFPGTHFDFGDGEHGMTLRDYFAAKAMQAFLHPGITKKDLVDWFGTDSISEAAYQLADKMLEIRKS